MKTVTIICPTCSKPSEKNLGHYNRAIKLGNKMYCSHVCFGVGRKLEFDKHLKTTEQLKQEKAEYDRQRRKSLGDTLKIAKKKYYEANKETILPKMRVYNRSRMSSHVIYCRQPEQREKERLRNRKKKGLTYIKNCLSCQNDKQLIDFESYPIFPDRRLYICKDCQTKEIAELGVSIREVMQSIRSNLVKTKSNLKVKDVAKYPYLIEAHKYLLLLKRLTK